MRFCKAKYIAVLLAFMSALILYAYNGSIFELLDIRSNKIDIANCAEDKRLTDKLSIYFGETAAGSDTVVLYQYNTRILTASPDWYGKDGIVVRYRGKAVSKHQFRKYKYHSWRKIRYHCVITTAGQQIILHWKLSSYDDCNEGFDTLMVLEL